MSDSDPISRLILTRSDQLFDQIICWMLNKLSIRRSLSSWTIA